MHGDFPMPPIATTDAYAVPLRRAVEGLEELAEQLAAATRVRPACSAASGASYFRQGVARVGVTEAGGLRDRGGQCRPRGPSLRGVQLTSKAASNVSPGV